MFLPTPKPLALPAIITFRKGQLDLNGQEGKELHSVSKKARIGDADGTVQDMGWLGAVHNCAHPVCVEPGWRLMGHPAVIASPLSLSDTAQQAWSMG